MSLSHVILSTNILSLTLSNHILGNVDDDDVSPTRFSIKKEKETEEINGPTSFYIYIYLTLFRNSKFEIFNLCE